MHTSILGVKYNISVLRAETGEIEEICDGHNLILDVGLDMWGTGRSASMTYYCAVGTGTTPVERDSSTTTASRSGTTVTASAGFFEANDVGRLIKFDSGEEDYITTFTSTTEVETLGSGTIAASEFTIYYVDQTQLDAQSTRQNSFRTETGDNESTISAGIINHKRTHLFSAVGAAITYNEIGWSQNSTGNLFNRAIISGGVSLAIGDQLIVTSNLELTQSPQTSIAQANVGTGFDTSGTIQIEGKGCSAVNTSGGFSTEAYQGAMDDGGQVLEPSTGNGFTVRHIAVTESNPAFNTYGTPLGFSAANVEKVNYSEGSYVNGNYYRDKSVTFSTSQGNYSAIACIILGIQSFQTESVVRVRLTSTFEKLNTETLNIVFRMSWGRTLTNS